MQNWGWACEKVTAIEVVTAEGKILTCSKDENTCLYVRNPIVILFFCLAL